MAEAPSAPPGERQPSAGRWPSDLGDVVNLLTSAFDNTTGAPAAAGDESKADIKGVDLRTDFGPAIAKEGPGPQNDDPPMAITLDSLSRLIIGADGMQAGAPAGAAIEPGAGVASDQAAWDAAPDLSAAYGGPAPVPGSLGDFQGHAGEGQGGDLSLDDLDGVLGAGLRPSAPGPDAAGGSERGHNSGSEGDGTEGNEADAKALKAALDSELEMVNHLPLPSVEDTSARIDLARARLQLHLPVSGIDPGQQPQDGLNPSLFEAFVLKDRALRATAWLEVDSPGGDRALAAGPRGPPAAQLPLDIDLEVVLAFDDDGATVAPLNDGTDKRVLEVYPTDTHPRLKGGKVVFTVKLFTLSSLRAGRKFRLKVRPADVALQRRYPHLVATSGLFKTLAKPPRTKVTLNDPATRAARRKAEAAAGQEAMMKLIKDQDAMIARIAAENRRLAEEMVQTRREQERLKAESEQTALELERMRAAQRVDKHRRLDDGEAGPGSP